MNRRKITVLASLVVLLTGLFSACSDPTENEVTTGPVTGQVLLREEAFFVSADQMVLATATDSTMNYTVTGTEPVIAVGDVLVDPADGGYLRRVQSAVLEGEDLILETVPAALTDVLYRGSYVDTLSLPLAGGDKDLFPGYRGSRDNLIAPEVTLTPAGLQIADLELFSGTIRSTDVSARMVSGSYTIDPDLTIGFEVDGGSVWEYRAVLAGDYGFTADLQLSTSDSVYHTPDPVLLYSTTHTFERTMDRLPLILEVTLDFYAGCTLDLDSPADVAFGLSSAGPVSAGGRCTSATWGRIYDGDLEAGSGGAVWSAHPVGEAHFWVKPVAKVELYSALISEVGLGCYLGFTGESDGFIWSYELIGGSDLEVVGYPAGLDPDLPGYRNVWSNLERALAAVGSDLIAGMILQTSPPGARLMLDGGNTDVTTPDTLTHFVLGSHEVRLYLEGYNEHIETVDYTGGFVTVGGSLTPPGYPRPVFTISSPEDSARFDDNVISITGRVEMIDAGGFRSDYDGNRAVLSLNGADQIVDLMSGHFTADLSIFTGVNRIGFRATATNGNTGVSEPLTVMGDFLPDDVVITLTWNSPTSDLDLHVWNPANEHCFFANRQVSDGFLDIDDVNGFGPETFTATEAINGTYVVKVNSFSLHSDEHSDASLSIWLKGGAPQHYGPFHFTVADAMGSDPLAWWEVAVFQMEDGIKRLSVQPLPAERIRQIEADMRGLPAKP